MFVETFDIIIKNILLITKVGIFIKYSTVLQYIVSSFINNRNWVCRS